MKPSNSYINLEYCEDTGKVKLNLSNGTGLNINVYLRRSIFKQLSSMGEPGSFVIFNTDIFDATELL